MSSNDSSRKTAANKPAAREHENATQAMSHNKHSEGGKWPLPFDDTDKDAVIVSPPNPNMEPSSDSDS